MVFIGINLVNIDFLFVLEIRVLNVSVRIILKFIVFIDFKSLIYKLF